MNSAIGGVVTVATAIIGLAIIATLVSNRANTSNVIKSATGGFATALQAAEAPVTGGAGLGLPSLNTGISPS